MLTPANQSLDSLLHQGLAFIDPVPSCPPISVVSREFVVLAHHVWFLVGFVAIALVAWGLWSVVAIIIEERRRHRRDAWKRRVSRYHPGIGKPLTFIEVPGEGHDDVRIVG